MTLDPQVVRRRLAAMQALLAHLASLRDAGALDLSDFGTRLQVEHALMQLVNLAAEINAHMGASYGTPPQDYRQGFDILATRGVLTRELASRLKPSVGLRNVLTHEYVDADLDVVARAVPMALEGYGEYVRSVARSLP